MRWVAADLVPGLHGRAGSVKSVREARSRGPGSPIRGTGPRTVCPAGPGLARDRPRGRARPDLGRDGAGISVPPGPARFARWSRHRAPARIPVGFVLGEGPWTLCKSARGFAAAVFLRRSARERMGQAVRVGAGWRPGPRRRVPDPNNRDGNDRQTGSDWAGLPVPSGSICPERGPVRLPTRGG